MIDLPQSVFDTVEKILLADTDDFAELAKISGMDPATDYRHADLKECDFTGSDLSGFDFTGADLRGCVGLPSPEEAKKIGLILADAIINE